MTIIWLLFGAELVKKILLDKYLTENVNILYLGINTHVFKKGIGSLYPYGNMPLIIQKRPI